ncbi:MAG: glycosyl hydrolase family 28-related protein [Planctomycetota bacterium]
MSDDPTIKPARATDVRTTGARGDGQAEDAPAIQRALTESRWVVVPPGVYRIGRTLRIGSGTRLDVHPQATLVFADGAGRDRHCHLLTNSDHDRGNENITVRGGVWNGNNPGNRRPEGKLFGEGDYTGVMINFRNVRGLTVADAMLCDSESYHVRCTQVERFLFEHLRFHSTCPRPNNDGVHLGGFCADGIIRHLRGLGPCAPSDDLVALNADDAIGRIECQGKLRGPIRNVVIHDLQADQCHSFVRLLSVDSPLETIDISRIRGGCTACMVNMDAARRCRVPLFSDDDRPDGVGACRNIRIRDVRAFAAAPTGGPLIRLEEHVGDLLIEDVTRDAARDGSPDAPTIDARHLTGHHLEIEGLTDGQLAALRGASTTAVDAAPLTGFEGLHSVAAAFDREAVLQLPSGGFRRLALTRHVDK